MSTAVADAQPDHTPRKTARLHYLDWLRVLLILGVFLFHALHPFDELLDWHIKNAERSGVVTGILLLINPWGMPLFFLVAGAASKFALRRRTNQQYIRERVSRLAIPYIVGSILLSPLQGYLEALSKGTYQGSFFGFIPEMVADNMSDLGFTPGVFGDWGFHLWFLAFLFLHSVLALPVFRWFERDAGKATIAWLGRLVGYRGGILLFIIPLALARVVVHALAPPEVHGWLDFVYFFLFFLSGYVIYSDDRLQSAVRRDRWLLFAGGVLALAAYGGLSAAYGDQAFDWAVTFEAPGSIVTGLIFTIMSWGWSLSVLYLAMRYLNTPNRWLVYGNEAIMPFYLFHQPVIIVIAYFVVQWELGVLPKLLIVVLGGLVVSLGLVELLKRVGVLRPLLGMKSSKREKVE